MTTNNWTTAGGTDVAHEVDPISRIEGHLGVKVQVSTSGLITDANAHGNLWRGFENFLLGRQVNDAITFTQRICGVCPVPHGLTATHAADTVLGYSKGHITFAFDGADTDAGNTVGYGIPAAALLIRNLVLGAEFLMSSITHFYHLAAPSYVQGPAIPPWTPYFGGGYYSDLLKSSASGSGAPMDTVVPDPNPGTMQLWDAVIISYVKALKMRRLTFEAGALFAGRMPMTSSFVAGGATNDISNAGDQFPGGFTARCTKFAELIQGVGEWIAREYVPIAFTLGVLYQDFDSQTMDLDGTNHTNKPGGGYGAGLGRFLAWGGLPNTDGTLFFNGGVAGVNAAPVVPFSVTNKAGVYSQFLAETGSGSVKANLKEDITWSRYGVAAADVDAYGDASGNVAYPGDVTRTKPERSNGYSYMKAPRWNGYPCEVGPLARQVVNGTYPQSGAPFTGLGAYVALYTVNGAGAAVDAAFLTPELAAGLTNTQIGAPGDVLALVNDWLLELCGGLSTMDRLRARALESLLLVQKMVGTLNKNQSTRAITWSNDGWIHQLSGLANTPTWAASTAIRTTGTAYQGWGANEAPRGALMHHTTTVNGTIKAYQCIVPTTWNGSPKCANDRHGAIEAAMLGAPFKTSADAPGAFPTTGPYGAAFDQQGTPGNLTTEAGVEVLRIAQSFDPCIACAVH